MKAIVSILAGVFVTLLVFVAVLFFRLNAIKGEVHKSPTLQTTQVAEGTTQPTKKLLGTGSEFAAYGADDSRKVTLSMESASARTMVLMYHDVIPVRTRESKFYDVTPEELRSQLEFIKSHGGHFVSADDLYKNLSEGTSLPAKSVVLTFDDNYEGVADLAVPLLDEFEAPFTVFVHTNYVGSQVGRPKMTWDTLKSLVRDHRCTVGAHTASHPEDITTLPDDKQKFEMDDPQKQIEEHLGAKTPYVAWANGKYGELVKQYAQEAGYRVAFAMESGFAQQSRSMYEVLRFPFNKFESDWDAFEEATRQSLPTWKEAEVTWTHKPVRLERTQVRRTTVFAIVGGDVRTVTSVGRIGVRDFTRDLGAVGGINGGFFAMAAIQSNDNAMIGPMEAATTDGIVIAHEAPNSYRLRNRPLVMWDDKTFKIMPYDPYESNSKDYLDKKMPSATDIFLAGAWLVCDGRTLNREEILGHGSGDAEDPRRRSFFGVTYDGEPICGSSDGSVSSSVLAEAAVALGAQYAVLLDSGFSTSLVYEDEILVSGHSRKDQPSRPIPHAIMVYGATEDESQPGFIGPVRLVPRTKLEPPVASTLGEY